MKIFTQLLLKSMMLLLFFSTSVGLRGQSMANYAFTYSQTGSLEDLTTGATALLTGIQDDAATGVNPIGFDFYYMGVKYTHFSGNSNGSFRLHTSSGATAIGTSSVTSFTASTATFSVLAADNECGNGMRFKVIGTAPNRKFVFEWTQFYVHYTDITNAGNMQVWLSETTSKVDLAYGDIYNTSTSSKSAYVFLSAGSTAGASASVTIGATPTVNVTATSPPVNTIAAGTVTAGIGSPLVANLGSTAQGSRWIYTFTPPSTAPADPTSLTFTAKSAVGMTLNWVDNSTTESGFVVTRATDAAFTQNVVTTNVASTTAAATGGAYTSVVTGLAVTTTYYFKVQAINEGSAPGAGLTGSEVTLGPRTFTSIATGNWSAPATWDLGSAPTLVDNAIIAATHTVTLDGVATSITNLTVNTDGTLTHATAATSMTVLANLAVAGTYNVFFAPTTGKTLNVAGNITNTGTLDLSKTGSLLVLNGTAAQTVGGGILTGSLIASVTYNNTAAYPLITWNWAGVTVSGTMTLTSGIVNIGANELTLGNNAAGTLTYNGTTPKGGFMTAAGGKFSRWILSATSFTGSISNTGYTGLFPFVSAATGDVRLYYLARTSGSVSTAGKLSMNYNDAAGSTVVTPITDGTVSIDRRTNANWTVSSGGVNLGTGVFTIKIRAANFGEMADFTKLSPVLASTAATGTYAASTVTSGVAEVNRTAVTAMGLLSTFHIGSTNANTLNAPLISVATGNYSAGATWSTGVAPTATDNVIIAAGHTVTLDANSVAKSMFISGGATLIASANTLNVGTSALCTRTFTVNGTVDLSGSATINHFGNVSFNVGSTFTQSGGNFNVDGNAGGVTANSVASGTSLFSITAAAATNVNLTGGTITIVDPHAASTSDYAFRASTPVAINASTAHTLRFGDGVSTDAGMSAVTPVGFYYYLYVGSSYLQLGNVIANGGAGVNRFVSNTSTAGILGNLTINANSELRATSLYVAGNIVNNGLLTNASTINMASYASAIPAAATMAQSIGGSGVFRNAVPVATITAGGTGYVVGDVITVSGGTSTTAVQFKVTAVTAGAITALYGINYPIYSVAPTFPASVTGGTGSGATIASLTNILNTTAANMSSLLINNSNASGVTLNTPLSISGTFTLTSGLVNTSAANLLTLGTATATATLSGTPSATNMVVGPVARTFALSRVPTPTYTVGGATHFPVGKSGTYMPIFVDPTTAATGAVTITAEAFASNAGTGGAGVSNLSTKTWTATASMGAANLTNANVRVTDANITATSKLLHSATIGGTYVGTPGGSTAVAGSTVTTSAAIPVADYLGNFAYGDLVACTAPTASASALVTSLMTSTSFTGTFTAATDNPSGYLVVRYPSGGAATAPANGTLYATGTNLGGTVVANLASPTVTFNQTGLTAATTYDYHIYSYNNSGCAGPTYYATALVTPVTTCASVIASATALVASAITTTEAVISWTASTTPSVEYEIDVSTNSAFTSFVSIYNARNIGTRVTANLVGLTAGTNYFVRVRAVITGCYSSNSTTLTMGTSCDPATSFTQNFDGVTGGLFPSCWSKVGTTGSAYTQAGTIGTSPNVLYLFSSGTAAANLAYVSMPPVSNADAGTYRLTFKARSNSSVGGIIEVGYFNDPNDVATFTALGSYTTTSTTVVNNFSLSPVSTPTGITTLIFKHTGSPANSVLIDDVVYELIPAPTITALSANVCSGPTTLTITGTNLTGASAVTVGGVAVAAILTNTATTITATVNAGTSGTVAVTTAGGMANSTRTYAVGNLAAVTVAPSVTYLCGAGTATLTASSTHSGYTYAWTSLTPSTNLSAATGATTTATLTESSDFTLVASDAGVGCSETFSTSVAIYPFPSTTMTATPTTVCAGTAVALGSGLSAGNFSYSTITHAPKTAPSNAVTLINNGVGAPLSGGTLDDGGWAGIPIGFTYNYFGTNYSTIAVGTNGTLMFGTVPGYSTTAGDLGQYNFALTPTSAFPNTGNPGNVIANVAQDNQLGTSGTIKYWTSGSAPNRKFIVSYIDVPEYSGTGTTTSQVIFYETSGLVEIHCTNASTSSSRAKIIGLQDATKLIGATAVNGLTTNITNAAYRFSPPSNYNTTWSSASTGNGLSGTLSGSNVFTAAATPTTGGTKTYQIVFTNPVTGCTNSTAPATIDVVVDALPTTATAGPDQSLAASTFTLAANAPSVGTGEWSVVSGDGLINALINPTSTVSMPVGTSTLRWAVTNGSCAASSDTVVITSNYSLGDATTTTSCQPFATVVINGTNNTSWVPLLDGTKIVAAIKANGNNLGTVSGGYFVNGTGSMRMSNGNAYMNRNVSISAQNAPTSDVDVRYYLSSAEWTALTTAAPTITDNSFTLTRIPGGCNTAFFGAGTTVTGATSAAINGYRVIQFATNAFSDFYVSGPNTVIPIELKSLTAAAKGSANIVKWTTATELNVAEFIIERSANGRDAWTAVARTKAAGSTQTVQNYQVIDNEPLTLSYYRLRSVETSGKSEVSKTVAVKRNGGKLAVLMVSPNPTTEGVNVDFSTSKIGTLNVVMTDIVGRVVKTERFTTVEGTNLMRLDLSNLSVGTYIMTMNDGETVATQRIVKQ